jgi:hypothetical protein
MESPRAPARGKTKNSRQQARVARGVSRRKALVVTARERLDPMNDQMKEMTKIEAQLAAARAVLAASGKSPRQLGEESRLRVIEWIYHWGCTSATIVQLLLGRTSAGYAQKLARQGWLVATKTKSGLPNLFFTLSEQGRQEAERHAAALYRYPEIDPFRVNQQQIRHYLIAQSSTVNALNAGVIIDYETERMFSGEGDKSGVKRPDVAWMTKAGLTIGAEVELSAKWARDLDMFTLGIVRALQSGGDKPARYNRFAIISDSPAIINRYRAAMQPGVALLMWKKDQRGHWVIDKTIKVPEWLINKVDFHLIGD